MSTTAIPGIVAAGRQPVWAIDVADLPAMMGLVQESVTQASDAIGARYFMSGPVQEWTGEIL